MVLALLVPGLGHFYLGRRGRALAFFAIVILLFVIGLSIDGPRDVHDRYRVDKGGKPTFDKVMRGVGVLKQYRVPFNTLTVGS